MTATQQRPSRLIVSLSPYQAYDLAVRGQMPSLPTAIDDLRSVEARPPTMADFVRFEWFAVVRPEAALPDRPIAVGAFERRLDPHSLRDVLDVVHIAGSRRGVVEVCRFFIELARAERRGIVGFFDFENREMLHLVARLGLRATGVRVEL